ncbi:alpha-1B-glycoprotein-like [Arvicanthis niloticus]|uniref:alpha-1B-glycoprotein-like n=1 Tax=Arvicanthis niloticus TaxID=61156 RepID=UPI00402B9E24
MSLLATVLLFWGFTLDLATDAATCPFRDAMENNSLPRPWLSADPVHWITPGLSTFLLCQARVQGVVFLLRREGDEGFLEVAETDGFLKGAGPSGSLDVTQAGYKEHAIFLVHQPGNYSCSYQTHRECAPSKPSGIVTIEEYATPPPPMLTSSESSTVEPPHMTLLCVAPLDDVEFQLRQGRREMKVPMVSTSPEEVNFYLKLSDMGDQSPFTCRYRLSRMTAWSEDSEPLELMWSDEKLPAPLLTAEPSKKSYEAGSTVQFRCTAPRAGLRFGLYIEDLDERSLLQILESSGNETVFQLKNLSTMDSASYSCIYTELAPPYSGSAPSHLVPLLVNGPPPPPTLQALWTGIVPAGYDVVLRCHSDVPGVTIELLHDGKLVPYRMLRVTSTHSDLGLNFVGPQHTGNYTCRYTSWWPEPIHSEPSNPVELLVEGN